MKKLLAILALLTCILGLTACAGSDEGISDAEKQQYISSAGFCYWIVAQDMPQEELKDMSSRDWDSFVENLSYYSQYMGGAAFYIDGSTLLSGFESWWSAQKEIGDAEPPVVDQFGFDTTGYEFVAANETNTVRIPVSGSNHDATFEVTFDKNLTITGIATNIQYSFGEKMAKAGLNTLLGMGTVFVVLILICFIISAFALIPKLQKRSSEKAAAKDVKSEAVDNTIAQISEREEAGETDDLELIAVISAAIAASSGSSSTDGFVVRSIRRVNRR